MYFLGSKELIIFNYMIARCGHHYGPLRLSGYWSVLVLGTGPRLHRLGQTGRENGRCRPEGKWSFFSNTFAENEELSDLGQDNHLLLAIVFWETGLCAFNDTRLHQERCMSTNFFFFNPDGNSRARLGFLANSLD